MSLVQAGLALGVDVILGGTHPAEVIPLLEGYEGRYCPFLGHVTGHPSVLSGAPQEIASQAAAWGRHPRIAGFDLLAYRAKGDIPALIRTVCAATDKPVIVAGSIESPKQIEAVRQAGAAGFTVGTAALEGAFPAHSPQLSDQLHAVLTCLAPLPV